MQTPRDGVPASKHNPTRNKAARKPELLSSDPSVALTPQPKHLLIVRAAGSFQKLI